MDLKIKRVLYRYPNEFIYVVKSDNNIIKRCLTRHEAKKFVAQYTQEGAK